MKLGRRKTAMESDSSIPRLKKGERISSKLALVLALLFTPLSAAAAEMVVFIGSYRSVWDDTANPERAEMVAERLAAAAEKAGFKAAIREGCSDKPCIERILLKGTVALGALADVEASDASYDVRVELLPGGEGERFTVSGAFDDALFAFVAIEMAKTEKDDRTDTESSPTPTGETVRSNETRVESPTASPPRTGRPRIKPVYFWTSLGVTGALAVGWGALEVTVHQRYKALKRGDKDLAYWERSKSLQVVSRALFTAMATAATATFVFLFFTDFEAPATKDRDRFALLPARMANGGGLVLDGRF